MIKIVFATNNKNKIKEVQKLLPTNIELIGLKDIGCEDDIPETQHTIKGNSIQKVNYINSKYNLDCFADDTGLEISALNGDPGVLSARYAGSERNSKKNIEKVLKNLNNIKNRNARFKTVIALSYKGEILTFEGVCEGVISDEIQGDGGFGYDPIFKPKVINKTFAELSFDEKNKISHRAIAIKKFIDYFNKLKS
jgi:XTP/dITP diphosphohydrolase